MQLSLLLLPWLLLDISLIYLLLEHLLEVAVFLDTACFLFLDSCLMQGDVCLAVGQLHYQVGQGVLEISLYLSLELNRLLWLLGLVIILLARIIIDNIIWRISMIAFTRWYLLLKFFIFLHF